jgi:hypothetical protein
LLVVPVRRSVIPVDRDQIGGETISDLAPFGDLSSGAWLALFWLEPLARIAMLKMRHVLRRYV